MPIPNVKRMADKFICLMAFSFGEVAEKLAHVGKLSLSYIVYPSRGENISQIDHSLLYQDCLEK
ncbi:hypothetical protein ACWISP_02180 [Thermolongibacillus altinsuensis]|nr:hypothetical protein [Thermolongibacillus altinsuensis]